MSCLAFSLNYLRYHIIYNSKSPAVKKAARHGGGRGRAPWRKGVMEVHEGGFTESTLRSEAYLKHIAPEGLLGAHCARRFI